MGDGCMRSFSARKDVVPSSPTLRCCLTMDLVQLGIYGTLSTENPYVSLKQRVSPGPIYAETNLETFVHLAGQGLITSPPSPTTPLPDVELLPVHGCGEASRRGSRRSFAGACLLVGSCGRTMKLRKFSIATEAIPESELRSRVAELGQAISFDYQDKRSAFCGDAGWGRAFCGRLGQSFRRQC